MAFSPPAYTPQTWNDGLSGGTALNASHLNSAEASMVVGFRAGDVAVVNYIVGLMANTAFVIRESSGAYPSRATGAPGAVATSTVLYVGVDAPSIGGSDAINDVDLWLPTSV